MYRLTIIAGPRNAQPARGASFGLGHGENSIGRHSQNQIVLQSDNVSKKHCVLVVKNEGVTVKDNASSNGTFVNGELTQKKTLRAGDRISVGEFTFELSDAAQRAIAAPGSNVFPFPGAQPVNHGELAIPTSHPPVATSTPVPTTLSGKLNHYFEKFVMPYFYGMNERYDWKMIGIAFIALFIILNLVISISPLMEAQESAITREIMVRARIIAREISERNTPYFSSKQETKAELGSIGNGQAVKLAVIIDMDGKIIAPASNAGEIFTREIEAIYAIQARKLFAGGEEKGQVAKPDSNTVVAIEPIKVLNPRMGKNEVVAMTVVSVDTARASPGLGELSAVYANAMILSLFVGIFLFYILYRVTMKPFEIMNEQIDQAMRGERQDVKSPVHFEEIEPLWTIVDSVVKRLPKNDGGGSLPGAGSSSQSVSDYLPQFQAFGASQTQVGVMVLDGQGAVVYVNQTFEEICSIRSESALGRSVESSSPDQAFTKLVREILNGAQPGSEGTTDEMEFLGTTYRVQGMCFGTFGSPVCYLLTVARMENA